MHRSSSSHTRIGCAIDSSALIVVIVADHPSCARTIKLRDPHSTSSQTILDDLLGDLSKHNLRLLRTGCWHRLPILFTFALYSSSIRTGKAGFLYEYILHHFNLQLD